MTFVESTIGNLPKVARAKFLENDELFSFISICKFGSFKNPFAMITSRSELYFRFRRCILLVQKKKVISMNWFLWQQHKQLKIIEMSEAQPDTYDDEYMHQFQHDLTHKIY